MLIKENQVELTCIHIFFSSCCCLVQRRPLKKDGQVRKLIVLDFLGILSAITHMHYIKLHRGVRRLEGTRGSISKGPVLTMFKYVPAAL